MLRYSDLNWLSRFLYSGKNEGFLNYVPEYFELYRDVAISSRNVFKDSVSK